MPLCAKTMDYSQPTTYLFERAFVDVDDLAHEARQWDLDFRQLDRGAFRGHLFQFGAGDVHVTDARFHRKLQQKGAPPAGMRTVAVPATPDLKLEWRGKSIDGNSLMVFPEGAELASVSGPDFHVYTCTMSEELLSDFSDAMALGEFAEAANGEDAIRVAPAAIRDLRHLLFGVCNSVRQSPNILSSNQMLNKLTWHLPNCMIAAIAQTRERCPYIACRQRLLAVSRAEVYIDQHAADDIGIVDICKAAGVSERTLRYAFLERFGVGPKEFLQAFRHTAVRRQLRAADPKTARVADVANAWGFWHLGQFAADYRQRFGELPSMTLLLEPHT